MRRIVIGTAGHVDHGKTSLVKALTGIDTDRLAEEKRRGITLELGFAHLPLDAGTVAGVVDVPGHERFVKAMAAGAAGVDLVLLVVALDEGVMPQTREHLDICRLLGVPRGLVVLSKCDLAPALGPDWAALVEADLAQACAGTFLEGAPILPASAKTGEGLAALREALAALARQTPERPADGPVYLPVDRAFSLKGFGTVVTGTLLSGAVAPGDEVGLIPRGGERLRVRTVQVHGGEVASALAGQRTALNLPGVEAGAVERGAVVVRAGELTATSMLDVELDLLAAAPRPLRHRARLLLHLGTAQVPALVALLDRDALAPGGRAWAQLRLGAPVAALPGQRFILRGFGAIPGRGATLAGGRVLAVHPRKRRRRGDEATRGLAALAGDDPAARLAFLLEEAGWAGLTEVQLFARSALPARQLERALGVLSSRGEALLYDRERRAYASAAVAARLSERILEAVRGHGHADPLAPGMPREELRQRLGAPLDPKLFARLLLQLGEAGRLVADGEVLRERRAPAPMAAGDEQLKESVARTLAQAGLTPPYLDELARRMAVSLPKLGAVVRLLEKEGRAVRVTQELYFDAAAVGALKERLVAFLAQKGRVSTQEFKELAGTTRKHAIPLSEYFDSAKVTLRVGEARVLRGAGG